MINEISKKTTEAKAVLSLRCSHQLKYKLSQKAEELGLTVSELAENFLENTYQICKEFAELKKLTEDQEKKANFNISILEQKCRLYERRINFHLKTNERLRTKLTRLKKECLKY
jgi:hypothetical protein